MVFFESIDTYHYCISVHVCLCVQLTCSTKQSAENQFAVMNEQTKALTILKLLVKRKSWEVSERKDYGGVAHIYSLSAELRLPVSVVYHL